MYPPLIETAKSMAEREHANQEYGNYPYICHIQQVVDKTRRTLSEDIPLIGDFEQKIIIAAYLHDIVEDTDINSSQIYGIFDFDVGEMVNLVTDPEGKNRKERKEALYTQFEEYPHGLIKLGASIVKLSDRYCNHQYSMLSYDFGKMKMYHKELYKFIDIFGSDIDFHKGVSDLINVLFIQHREMERMIKRNERNQGQSA